MPSLPITIYQDLWDGMVAACGEPFVGSYFSGARQVGSLVTPRTHIAFERITRNKAAMEALERFGIKLVEPLHFGHPDRPDTINPARKLEAWRPLTDEEYQRASLTAKIDHHRGMQFLAEMKAGPMWRGGMKGGPVGPERLPPKWHEWRAKAANHRDEARRLWAFLVGDDPNARRTPMHAQQRTTELAEPMSPPPPVHGPLDEHGVSLAMRQLMARKANPAERQSA